MSFNYMDGLLNEWVIVVKMDGRVRFLKEVDNDGKNIWFKWSKDLSGAYRMPLDVAKYYKNSLMDGIVGVKKLGVNISLFDKIDIFMNFKKRS